MCLDPFAVLSDVSTAGTGGQKPCAASAAANADAVKVGSSAARASATAAAKADGVVMNESLSDGEGESRLMSGFMNGGGAETSGGGVSSGYP